ncbi:hypothetical protein ACHAW6_012033 [Cyclotella cf. meneghiniana]
MHLWDRLVPQAEMMLNLLRQSKVAPKVSAYAYLNGLHDYNLPLAPLGCVVQVHDKPGKCKSWDMHSCDGWYIGTSDEHYQCFRIFRKDTRAEMVSDTVYFKQKYSMMPTVTRSEKVMRAAKDLAQAIKKHLPTAMLATDYKSVVKISKIFDKVASRKMKE